MYASKGGSVNEVKTTTQWNEDSVTRKEELRKDQRVENCASNMPRAFLIARRKYNGTGEFEETGREYSPERGVRLAEYGGGQQPTSDGASECGSESSSECPEELYNLTKLAEVSLAAAAGTLVHPASLYHHSHHHPYHQQQPRQTLQPLSHEAQERTRAFFERIESERESLVELKTRRQEEAAVATLEGARLPASGRFVGEYKSEDKILTETISTTTTTTQKPASGKVSPIIIQQHEQSIDRVNQQQQPDGSEEHECPDCGKKYSTSSNLARHRQTHRSLGDKKARRCPHCDKVYVSIPAYSMHVRTHNQGCKCHFCGKCFSRPWLLQGHIRTHTGEKPFKCTICNKAFADKSNLRAHIQTHSNTKPHVCARCGKAFALKSYLYKHEESSCMRSHHQQQKRESATSPPTSRSNPLSPQPTASPTSVIVPPRNFHSLEQQPRPNSAFSAIIRHTRTSPDPEDSNSSSKRSRSTPDAMFENETQQQQQQQQGKDLLSRMVIRTSVISPNPEHLARYSEKKLAHQQQPPQQSQLQQQSHQAFDFNDPNRVSAFSRPQSMTLNLAIA